MSVIAIVKVRVLVLASNSTRRAKVSRILVNALVIGTANSSASGVGCMPRGVRTNTASLSRVRSRPSALLTAGCESPRLSAASETLRSW
jgi:hypothetical protein